MTYTSCGLRVGTKYARHTAGALFAMCPCGYLMPPIELPDSESTRFVMFYIIKLFEGFPYVQVNRKSNGFVVVFDDMCHLLR